MKIAVTLAACALVCSLFLNFLPVNGEEAIYSDTVRLHIRAASDSDEDQALKLLVRDRVLALLEKRLDGVSDSEAAAAMIEDSLDALESEAEKTLSENGSECKARVFLTLEEFPEREYDGFTLPAGTYRSLRIDIGKADGHNWWCVIFPSVCTVDAVRAEEKYAEAGFTPEQYRLIDNKSGGKYKVRFKILELLAGIFS